MKESRRLRSEATNPPVFTTPHTSRPTQQVLAFVSKPCLPPLPEVTASETAAKIRL